MHVAGRLAELKSDPGVLAGHSAGLSRFPLVGRHNGSPHQAMTVYVLAAGGRIARQVNSFEKGIYILEGSVTVSVAGRDEPLSPDAYAFIDCGVPHAFANPGAAPVRWFEVAAPAPGGLLPDTAFVDENFPGADSAQPFRRGRFDPASLPRPSSEIGLAGFGHRNVGNAALEVIQKQEFGPSQFNLMVVQYGEGGFITDHDHPFEEGFFFLAGEIEAVLDGKTYRLQAGDFCWSGAGSPHAFYNRAREPVRWLETQVPQPPVRIPVRFRADWETFVAGG